MNQSNLSTRFGDFIYIDITSVKYVTSQVTIAKGVMFLKLSIDDQ